MKLFFILIIGFIFSYKFICVGQSLPTSRSHSIKLFLKNPINFTREDEIIELALDSLLLINKEIFQNDFVIEDLNKHNQLPYQIIPSENNQPQKLIFQITLLKGDSALIEVKNGKPELFKIKTYGRFVHERKDDFAWENDKIAFRMYGPALQASGEISNGMDVWVKRTQELVIDKWYKMDKYHVDHGEGLDCYKVGATLGAGGIAPFAKNKLFLSENFISYKVITTGALRTIIELKYNTWNFNGLEINEKKRITLDAGSNLNQVDVTYHCEKADTIPVAVGIIKRKGKGSIMMDEEKGIIAYSEPIQPKNGTTYVGVIVPSAERMSVMEDHLVALASATNDKPFKYYQGAAWDKAGIIKTQNDWIQYLEFFLLKKQHPLIVKFK